MLPINTRLKRQPSTWWRLRHPAQVLAYSRNRIFRHIYGAGTAVVEPSQTATVPWNTGINGVGGDFNGSSQGWTTHSVIPSSPAEFTMLAMVRPDVTDSADRTILSLSNTADDTVLCRMFVLGTGNLYAFQVRANDGSTQTVAGSPAGAGVAAVVGVVYRSGTGERSLWVNGGKDGTDTTAGVGGPITFNRTSIGLLSRSSNIHWFDGLVYEAHILPYALHDAAMAMATRSPLDLLNWIYAPLRMWMPEATVSGITGPLIGRGRLLNSPLIGGRLVQ